MARVFSREGIKVNLLLYVSRDKMAEGYVTHSVSVG